MLEKDETPIACGGPKRSSPRTGPSRTRLHRSPTETIRRCNTRIDPRPGIGARRRVLLEWKATTMRWAQGSLRCMMRRLGVEREPAESEVRLLNIASRRRCPAISGVVRLISGGIAERWTASRDRHRQLTWAHAAEGPGGRCSCRSVGETSTDARRPPYRDRRRRRRCARGGHRTPALRRIIGRWMFG